MDCGSRLTKPRLLCAQKPVDVSLLEPLNGTIINTWLMYRQYLGSQLGGDYRMMFLILLVTYHYFRSPCFLFASGQASHVISPF